MKITKILMILLLVLVLASCSEVIESLNEPVDPEDHTEYHITITEDDTISSVAKKLDEQKLISTQFAFKDYIKEQKLDIALQKGDFILKRSMSLEEIVKTITVPPVADEGTVTVTFAEGLENREMAKILEENGVVKADEFLSALKEHSFDYDFLKDENSQTALEGFLFPDTYEFYKNANVDDVINKMLSNFNDKFSPELVARTKELGMSIHDVIVLASIVEREAARDDERALIAGVFHNRLQKPMRLESCATVQYVLEERKPILTYDDMAIDSPYNTYLHEGLPPAPIANPGLQSIKAALYPEKSNYLFFVASNKGDGSHLFAETFEQHQENIKKSDEN